MRKNYLARFRFGPHVSSFRYAAIALIVLLFACAEKPEPLTIDTEGDFIALSVGAKRLELFLSDDNGHVFNRFETLEMWLRGKGKRLVFATNAGIYRPDFLPLGLYVDGGTEYFPLDMGNGEGNFYLKPNGVFMVGEEGPTIVETSEYAGGKFRPRIATQSGPLLLRGGSIHPALNPHSSSLYVRNGVGIRGDEAVFVISKKPVRLYDLAALFRDRLRCSDALYLDGAVSGLYIAGVGRWGAETDLGPIVAITE